MINQRKISRYHLLHPLAGFIEHGEVRYQGEVIELSTSGFRFRLGDSSKEAFVAENSTHDYGEVFYQREVISGFGEVRYVRPEGKDLLIGFKWDESHANENIGRSFSIIARLISQKSAGCVNVSKGVVELTGHVSGALAEDIQQAINPKAPCISLRQCTSIDDSGLEMLARMKRAKVEILEASTEMLALLERHRQAGPLSTFFAPEILAAAL